MVLINLEDRLNIQKKADINISHPLYNKKIVMTPLQKMIEKNNYNIFIDGNNVLFFIDRSITINSFRRLEAVFEKASSHGNVLITLHQRHREES